MRTQTRVSVLTAWSVGITLAGCSAIGPARVSEPMLSCTEAMRIARIAVMRFGYTVRKVVDARPGVPGRVVGAKDTGWQASMGEGDTVVMLVTVTCTDAGADLEATTNESFVERRTLPKRFATVVEKELAVKPIKPRISNEPEQGLVVQVEPLRGRDAQVEFGANLTGAGITPVKIEINNRSPRRYEFHRKDVQLVTVGGSREEPMQIGDATGRIATDVGAAAGQSALREKEIQDGSIAPGGSLSGFLYFKASTYRRVRVVLTDVESQEEEGFSVEF